MSVAKVQDAITYAVWNGRPPPAMFPFIDIRPENVQRVIDVARDDGVVDADELQAIVDFRASYAWSLGFGTWGEQSAALLDAFIREES